MPECYNQFVEICDILEKHYHDMQDMEFTIEDRHLYMLQTRNGKRTATAALKIACDLVDEGMIDDKQAVLMIDPRTLDALLHPQFDADALKKATPLPKHWPLLLALPAVRSYSPQKMPKNGLPKAKRSFWSAWRLLPRTSRA